MFDTGLLNDQCREFPLAIDGVKWFPRPLAAQGGYMARFKIGDQVRVRVLRNAAPSVGGRANE